MNREEFRNRCKSAGICMWQVADAYGCAEVTFSKKLRHEITGEDEKKILAIIADLSKQKKKDN